MTNKPAAGRYKFGSFEFDSLSQRLANAEMQVALKPKAILLLQHLLEHSDQLVTRDELVDRLWPNQDVAEANLTQCIYELRKALGDKRDGATYIETVARRGYRLAVPVLRTPATRTNARTEPRRLSSIAVVPFTALPGMPRDEALEHGIANSLVTGLSKISGLTVRQVSGLPQYSEAGRDALAAARKLETETVLDGSLQHAGGRLRVTVKLVRVNDEAILWADRFDQPFTDIFEVEDAICQQVVDAIAAEIPRRERAGLMQRHTHDVAVHELFLKCLYYWHKWTPDGWRRSIECGREAIARDPQHAPSYVWTAASYGTLALAGIMPPHSAFAEARTLVDTAIELDPGYGDAYQVRGAIGHFYDWDWITAKADFARSFESPGGGGEGRGLYALLLVITQRFDDALREAERARVSDPLSLIVNTGVGEVYLYRREFDLAEKTLRHTLSLDAHFANAHMTLSVVHAAQGRYADALAAAEAAATHAGIPRELFSWVGYALALNGDRDAAIGVRDNLAARAATDYVDPYAIALINTGLGDRDAAFAAFDVAVEARSPELIYIGANAIFDDLRSDSRFNALLQRIGLP